MIENGFHKFLKFLSRLETERVPYTLAHYREEAVMVNVSLPGERWEIEFFENGSVEIEKFISDGPIYGEDALPTFFEKYKAEEIAEIHHDDDLKSVSKPIALQRYKSGRVSLARAAEMAYMDQENFKELLREAGIARSIEPSGETFGQEVEQVIRLRKPAS